MRCRPILAAVVAVAACSDLPTEPPLDEVRAPAADVALSSVSPPAPGCTPGVLPGGALSLICFPADWNGDVVLWGHGYVSPFDPLALPDDAVDGTPVSAIVLGLRFAYATTSYRRNGLVARDAATDLAQLSEAVRTLAPQVRKRYLVGASEGGLATALALEKLPQHFDGGLLACGPVGSFRGQVDYFGDARVLFDYFFPGVFPAGSSPVLIEQSVIDAWPAIAATAAQQMAASPSRTAQLIRTAGIAVDPNDASSAVESVLAALWYNVFATNDARVVLGGVPYDNRYRWYTGSSNDFLLNLRVRRVRASSTALNAMKAYEATGRLARPAQMIHTRYDPVIPFWQAQVYQVEALFGSGLTLLGIPSDNYGHCAFDVEEVLASFALLVLRVSGSNLVAIDDVFPDRASVARFEDLARGGGADPAVWTRARVAEALARAR